MTKKLIEKNIKLSLELDNYLNKHPNLYARIPHGAHVMITVKGDNKFNKNSTENILGLRGKVVEARKEDGRWTVSAFMPA